MRYERVVECCQEVTTLQPGNVKGWYRLGLAHHNLRDFDAAKAALKEANQIAEGQGELLLSIFYCQESTFSGFKDMIMIE